MELFISELVTGVMVGVAIFLVLFQGKNLVTAYKHVLRGEKYTSETDK